ncbi:hypothetical protein MCUN1_000879 [Malassezia cuniculi]|uniref:Ca3427-like PBP 2 domain-containing protein n=1 Tax=Malassezia cuniculi TaxID=948313 RepID=A0AAF0JA86_9BASI|nr:hypothetical protein MCUN1_000879 [Malassezia cuniculi]
MALRIGYVPEHFAAPLLKLAASEWGRKNIELVSQPSGTGQMLTSLDPADQKIDVAVALTEGLITGIARGRTDYKLVGSYVRTSLNWAIITGTNAAADRYQTIADLRGSPVGVSRLGSGSQLMASVLALREGWVDEQGHVIPLNFVVNNDFKTLRDGVNQAAGHETGFFMWEWFTTKPYQDSGEVRFIGSIPTPWPSWTIAASTSVLAGERLEVLRAFLTELDSHIRAFANPTTRADRSLHRFIEEVHQYKPEDIEQWAAGVRWAGEETPNPDGIESDAATLKTNTSTMSADMIRHTLHVLGEAGVLDRKEWEIQPFVASETTKLI